MNLNQGISILVFKTVLEWHLLLVCYIALSSLLGLLIIASLPELNPEDERLCVKLLKAMWHNFSGSFKLRTICDKTTANAGICKPRICVYQIADLKVMDGFSIKVLYNTDKHA